MVEEPETYDVNTMIAVSPGGKVNGGLMMKFRMDIILS